MNEQALQKLEVDEKVHRAYLQHIQRRIQKIKKVIGCGYALTITIIAMCVIAWLQEDFIFLLINAGFGLFFFHLICRLRKLKEYHVELEESTEKTIFIITELKKLFETLN